MWSGSPVSQSCADRKHMGSYTSTLLVIWYEVTHLNPTVITVTALESSSPLVRRKSQERHPRQSSSPALVQARARALGC